MSEKLRDISALIPSGTCFHMISGRPTAEGKMCERGLHIHAPSDNQALDKGGYELLSKTTETELLFCMQNPSDHFSLIKLGPDSANVQGYLVSRKNPV